MRTFLADHGRFRHAIAGSGGGRRSIGRVPLVLVVVVVLLAGCGPPPLEGRPWGDLTRRTYRDFVVPAGEDSVEIPIDITMSIPLRDPGTFEILMQATPDTPTADVVSVETLDGVELPDAGGSRGYLVNDVLVCEPSPQPICSVSLVAAVRPGDTGITSGSVSIYIGARTSDPADRGLPGWAFLDLTVAGEAVDG